MFTRVSVLAPTLVCFVGLAAPALAQKTTEIHPGKGGSPHVRTEWTVAGANISVEYGRPSLKGRTVGQEVASYGKVWRTGADEATTLKTGATLVFGSLTVPAGTYTLWTLPGEAGWKLIVNKQTGQWGTNYDEKQDLGRVDMKVEKVSSPVEQHTISIEPGTGGGVLQVTWGNTRASVPFTVKK
jgi:hypothetical protein